MIYIINTPAPPRSLLPVIAPNIHSYVEFTTRVLPCIGWVLDQLPTSTSRALGWTGKPTT